MKNLNCFEKLMRKSLMAMVAMLLFVNGLAIADSEVGPSEPTTTASGAFLNLGNVNLGPVWNSSSVLGSSGFGYGSGLSLYPKESPDPFTFTFDSSPSLGNYNFNDPFYMWSSNFSDDDLLSFGKSDCRKSCDSNKWNCGWGPVTDEYLQDQLKRCGFEYNYDKKIQPETISQKVTIQCTIGGQVESADTTLDSIKDLIGYDCASLAELGDAHYCTCVLNKAGDPKDLTYTPLTAKQVATIESLITLNEYQEDVRALKNSLGSVGNILSDAMHSENEELKKLIDSDEEGKVCMAGGFRQLSDFLTTSRDDLEGKSVCGGRGTATLNRINNLNKLEDQAHASASEAGGRGGDSEIDVSTIDEGPGFLEDVNDDQADYLEKENGYDAEDTRRVREGRDLWHLARRACAGAVLPLQEQQIPVPGNGSGHCRNDRGEGVSPTFSVSQQLVFIMRKYRSEGNGDPAAFVAKMQSEGKGRRMLRKLKRAVSDKYKIVDKGIFKHHAYQPSAMEMMIETLDTVIPAGADINTTSEAELVTAVDKGMGKLEEKVVREALGRCKQFVESQVKMCQELDKRGTDQEVKKEISVGDYKDFKPERSLFYSKIPNYLGGLKEYDDDALFRKFSQLRCARIMGDEKLSAKAFREFQPREDSDSEEEKTGIDAVVAWDKESSSADVSASGDSSVFNPYKAEESVRNQVFAKSKSSELRDWAKSVRESSPSGGNSKGSLAGVGSPESVTRGNMSFQDNQESLASIAEASRQALGADQSNPDSTSSNLLPSNYTDSVRAMSERERKREEEKAEKEKDNAEQRLEVIAQRLADIMGKQKDNSDKIETKKQGKSDEELAKDPEYEKMLIEKLELEREIARLNREKLETQQKKEKAKAQIAEIDSVNNGVGGSASNASGASGLAGGPELGKKPTAKPGTSSAGSSRSRSGGSGAGLSGSGGGGGSSFANSADSQNFFDNAPYVITLTQDQVTAIKDKFQVVENPNTWKPGGKPPVIRDGNIYYELAVKDGKIVVDALGRPVKKKALNGFNVVGQRRPASTVSELSNEVNKADVLIERAKRVKELNDVLDGAKPVEDFLSGK